MNLISNIGETRTFTIPLKWGNRPFIPGAEWGLTFTVKADKDADDSQAIYQKTGPGTMSGLEVSGSTATAYQLRADTHRAANYPTEGDPAFEAAAGSYYWEIQAMGLGEGEYGSCQIVASGTYSLTRGVTHLGGPSQTIHTTEAPVFRGQQGDKGDTGANAAELTHAAAAKGIPIDADELGILDSEAAFVTKKLTWASLKATLKTYFDTLYLRAMDTRHDLGGIAGTITPDTANGSYQSGHLTAAATLAAPSGAADGDTMIIRLTSGSSPQPLGFSGILLPAGVAEILPLSLEPAYGYRIELHYAAAGWELGGITEISLLVPGGGPPDPSPE